MWHPSFKSHNSHPDVPHRGTLHLLSERIKNEIFGEPATRCSVCHAELAPDEIDEGMCRDQAACCLRRYSQRCF